MKMSVKLVSRAAVMAILGALPVVANAAAVHSPAGNLAIQPPPPAVALAQRLHMAGSPVIGNQPQGNAGPWLIWARPTVPEAKRILSVGPLGAKAAFDYFDVAAESNRGGPDRGPALSSAAATRIAIRWLRHVGAAVPSGRIRVIRGTQSTIIGGTGLCCWHQNLDMVVFGGRLDVYGTPVNSRALIYVAASRQVVQANVSPQGEYRYPLPARCVAHTHPDSRGVPVGPRCFSYPAMAGIIWTVALGGHEPYLIGPGWFSAQAAVGAKLSTLPNPRLLKTVSASPSRVVYTASKGGVAYRFTQVAAFPGLRSSTWPLIDVERVR
jgi:hypothetical protein